MFKSTRNKGFHMTFKNGITISVQFGSSNYCERKNMNAPIQEEMKMDIVESSNAEIAIWDSYGKWFSFGLDEVKGWVGVDEVATWIILCTAATSMEDLRTRALNCNLMEKKIVE